MKELTRTDVVLHVALQQAVFMVLEGFWWLLHVVLEGFRSGKASWISPYGGSSFMFVKEASPRPGVCESLMFSLSNIVT